MATILIQPAGARDEALHKAQYEALRDALVAEGHDAVIQIPIEGRSGGISPVVAELAIHLGEGGLLLLVTEAVKRFLRNFRRPESGEPRTATIYGPDGEVLATVELEDDAERG